MLAALRAWTEGAAPARALAAATNTRGGPRRRRIMAGTAVLMNGEAP